MRLAFSLIILFAIFVVFPYFVVPLMIVFGKGMKAQFNVDVITPENFMPDARLWVGQQVETLRSLGFVPQHYLRNRDSAPNVQSYVVLLVNVATKDQAMVAAFYTKSENGMTPGTRYVEFSTKFTDESEVDTMNSAQPLAFLRTADHVATRLPNFDDVPMLYRIHQYLVTTRATGKTKRLPAPGEEIAELQVGVRRGYEKQVAFGLMEHLPATDSYKQTLWGAFFMVYRQLFPVKQYELMRDKSNADTLKREAAAWQQATT